MKHIFAFLCLLLSISVATSQELIKEFRLQDRPQHLDVKDIIPTDDGYYVIADRSSYEIGIGGALRNDLSLLSLNDEGAIRAQKDFSLLRSSDTDYSGRFQDKVSYQLSDKVLYVTSLSGLPVGENGIIVGYSRQLTLNVYDLQTGGLGYWQLPEPSQYDERIKVLHVDVIHRDSIHVYLAPFSDEPRNFFDEYRIHLGTSSYEVIHHDYSNFYVQDFSKEETGSLQIMDSVSSDWKIVSTIIKFESSTGVVSQYTIPNRIGKLKTRYIQGAYYVLIDKRILYVSESGDFSFITDSIPMEYISDFNFDVEEQTFYATSTGGGFSADTIRPQIGSWKTTDKQWVINNIPGEALFLPSTLEIIEDKLVVGGTGFHFYNYWLDTQSEYSDSSHVGNGIIRFLDFQVTTPTVDVRNNDFEVSIFPNPATKHVTVRSPEKMSRIQLFDYSGRLVEDIQNLEIEVYQLPVADLSPGTYQIQIGTRDGKISSAPLLVL